MKTILVDAIHAFVIKGKGIFKELHDLLETYSNRKIILTGADDKQMEQFGLHDMPYAVFTLKHDPEKSDPEYYRQLLERFGLHAEDVAYFEHDAAAVESARSVGIATHHYDSEARDLAALKRFLDEQLSEN